MSFNDLAHASRELGPAARHVFTGHDFRLHGLEVDVDARHLGELRANRPLQPAAGAGRGGQGLVARQLRMHGEVQRPVGLALHRHVV